MQLEGSTPKYAHVLCILHYLRQTIALYVPGRNHAQCLQRWSKVLKPGLVKGHWSREEDYVLEKMVLRGCHSWAEVSSNIPGRTAKQCRERWKNHLDPSIIKAFVLSLVQSTSIITFSFRPFTPEEDKLIQTLYESIGNRWTKIAELLPVFREQMLCNFSSSHLLLRDEQTMQ